MEKRGVIEEGRTPPEDAAADEPLEEHLTKRAAEAAQDVRTQHEAE